MPKPAKAPKKVAVAKKAGFKLSKNMEQRLPLAERASASADLWDKSNGVCALCGNALDPDSPDSIVPVFISASQQRKTRAGLSFERHIGRMLRDGNVRFQEQVVTGGRRPDFVLPDVRTLKSRKSLDALVLSCKTTLKERWKQVTKEQFDAPIFLATVDDRVAYSAIEDMERYGIMLVVPESLKNSEELCYRNHPNVISFKHLFEEEIRARRPILIASGFELVSPRTCNG